MAAELTLGAEEELHLIDLATSKLSASAPQSAGLFRAMVRAADQIKNTDSRKIVVRRMLRFLSAALTATRRL